MKISFFPLLFLLLACSTPPVHQPIEKKKEAAFEKEVVIKNDSITCTDQKCFGIYKGVEFDQTEKGDIAHQFSNKVAKAVGDQLKQLYKEQKYSKVDFDKITMTTEGMNDGDNYVIYTIEIPFKRVIDPCNAMTAFDHSGGWNHFPAIRERKKVLLKRERTTVIGGKLEISQLKKTKEGLQEFWIQWKHKEYQSSCK